MRLKDIKIKKENYNSMKYGEVNVFIVRCKKIMDDALYPGCFVEDAKKWARMAYETGDIRGTFMYIYFCAETAKKFINIVENADRAYELLSEGETYLDELLSMPDGTDIVRDNAAVIELLLRLSDYYDKKENKEKAVYYLEKLIEISPVSDAYMYWSMHYCDKNDFRNEMLMMKQAIELDKWRDKWYKSNSRFFFGQNYLKHNYLIPDMNCPDPYYAYELIKEAVTEPSFEKISNDVIKEQMLTLYDNFPIICIEEAMHIEDLYLRKQYYSKSYEIHPTSDALGGLGLCTWGDKSIDPEDAVKEARDYFERAIDLNEWVIGGHIQASSYYMLAIYQRDILGNIEKSYSLMKQAAELGDQESKSELRRYKKTLFGGWKYN